MIKIGASKNTRSTRNLSPMLTKLHTMDSSTTLQMPTIMSRKNRNAALNLDLQFDNINLSNGIKQDSPEF